MKNEEELWSADEDHQRMKSWGALNNLEYGRGAHWKQKVSEKRKMTKSFVVQKRH